MSVHLIFLFLFQGGLAFAFSFFIARIILSGSDGLARTNLVRGIRKIRMIVLAAVVLLPPAMFLAYYKSLPEGKSTSLAVWPAVWILVILLAVLLALSLAMRPKESKGR